ncbi:hypothetical protein [Streptomyces virginiae]|uniref:Uncharacterized protein n=1 Tax=Streptomyces virginiae TaxID=1961 RepID=A0ABZ1TQT4_STRVG|nr:hypothetical protein [Streptomyces virginiae]
MAFSVSFLNTAPISTGSGTAYKLWSYKIDGTGSDIPSGQRMALALPGDINVQDPSAYPDVTALDGSFLWRDPTTGLNFVGRTATNPGGVTITFVAPARTATASVRLFKSAVGTAWTAVSFTNAGSGTAADGQGMVVPAPGVPAYTGRPVADFEGALPYASEVFGVYQPLAGWISAQGGVAAAKVHPGSEFAALTAEQFRGEDARVLRDPALAALAERYQSVGPTTSTTPTTSATTAPLTPVGLVNLFREYFFEFDTFLGSPSGHIWVSPGGSVEVVETSTRRTLTEKTAELSEETTRKTEESQTDQDDVADAVKEDNSSDTKLGVSATGGVNAKIYHADVSASFATQNTVKRGSEETHKHSREQTAKVTNEIKRNFKTTFKTVTETTDTSSRRYVLQNNTNELANYEFRRKMRKVGVQLQHIGTRLCWQVYLPDPGQDLGLGDMVHVVEAPDLTSIPKPEPLPDLEDKLLPFHFEVPFLHDAGPDEDAKLTYLPQANICRGINTTTAGHDDTVQFCFEYPLPPVPPGYQLASVASVDRHSAQIELAPLNSPDLLPNPDVGKNTLKIRLTYANWQGKKSMPFDAMLRYIPTDAAKAELEKKKTEAKAAYDNEVARVEHEAYGKAVRERLRLVSSLTPRRLEDLRSEERRTVFRDILRRLEGDGHYPQDPHHPPFAESEQIRQLFDVEEMLYFVAPDYWRPGPVNPPVPTRDSVGRYPVPSETPPALPPGTSALPLAGQTVAGWYSRADEYKSSGTQPAPEWRVNYLITEETQPAPLGSSLGWLIQIDGDERRNEFLNAAWVKAIMPVRPGQEVAALAWLLGVEGSAGLGLPYPVQPGDPADFQNKSYKDVLQILVTKLQAANTDVTNTLAAEKVFETGFDPLEGGFRKPDNPYQIFDQWIEVLPTDQVAAVAVRYDPRTGQQL